MIGLYVSLFVIDLPSSEVFWVKYLKSMATTNDYLL